MAEVQVAEHAAGRDVRERIRLAIAPRAVAELATHLGEARGELALLALDRLRALLLRGAPALHDDRARRIAHAVGERFPAPYDDALARGLGNQARHRTDVVEIFDDDTRIVERDVVVEHQDGNLAERIEARHVGIRSPRR